MSDDQQKKERKQIKTSALMTKKEQEELIERIDELSEEESTDDPHAHLIARPKVAPWSKSEPLTKIHSILGHVAQGDTYRNELDLVYDRIIGDADAPEYLPDHEDPPEEAFEPIIATHSEPWGMDSEREDDPFEFGASVGQVSADKSFEDPLSQAIGEDIQQKDPIDQAQILGGMNLDDFDLLHESAKSSGQISKEEVDNFVAKHDPQIEQLPEIVQDSSQTNTNEVLSEEELEKLTFGGDDWEAMVENKSPVEPSLLPKRERHPGEDPKPFFMAQDTVSELNFDFPTSNDAETALEESSSITDQEQESKQEDESSENESSTGGLALGLPEDTMVD